MAGPGPASSASDDLRDLGVGLAVFDLDGAEPIEQTAPGIVRVGVRRGPATPRHSLDSFDILLCVDPQARRPWVGLSAGALDAELAHLRDIVARQPSAAAVCAQVLRMTLSVSFDQSLVLESLGYSMLLASAGLKAWRAATPVRTRGGKTEPRVSVTRAGEALHIRLTRPRARNAVDAAMRDALVEALEYAVLDPDATLVILSGEGPAFSAGGDLDEFGSAGDPAIAHLIRVQQAPVRLVHQIQERLTVQVHGACVGAGIELPAAAGRVRATPDAYFRLPEVSMGLIPGAGGTASIPRRIGRRRACYMAISGRDVDASTALAWGLVDEVGP